MDIRWIFVFFSFFFWRSGSPPLCLLFFFSFSFFWKSCLFVLCPLWRFRCQSSDFCAYGTVLGAFCVGVRMVDFTPTHSTTALEQYKMAFPDRKLSRIRSSGPPESGWSAAEAERKEPTASLLEQSAPLEHDLPSPQGRSADVPDDPAQNQPLAEVVLLGPERSAPCSVLLCSNSLTYGLVSQTAIGQPGN